MRILVVGGTRFIGAAAVAQLHKWGHEIVVLNRGKTPATLPEGVGWIEGTRDDLGPCRDAIEAFGPEVVLHNVIATERHALQAIQAFGGKVRRLVMTSSGDVYRAYGRMIGTEPGEPEALPLTEDSALREKLYPYRDRVNDPTHDQHDYDKIPAERAVLTCASMEGVVLRLPMVLGPNDAQRRLLNLIKPMIDDRPAIVFSEQYARWRSTYGDVDNVGYALALACTSPVGSGRIYNVGDWALSILDLANALKEVTGWQGEFVIKPAKELPSEFAIGLDTRHAMVCSDQRIREELGYVRRFELTETIERTLAWELANPPVPMPDGIGDYEAEDRVLAALD